MTQSDAKAVSETRHRMANHQQLLSALARLRSQRASDVETARQLMWLAETISLVGGLERHRTGEGGVDLAAWLREMAAVWARRHGKGSAEVVVDVDPIMSPDSAASTLGLIAQELVINALTHGRRSNDGGRVELRLAQHGKLGVLTVSDDGPGLASGSAERFGLWLVRSLAGQVRGSFTLTSNPGVAARLEFPL